ncbi:MAG: helix-turn-helix transcriptional regulator [Bacteroidia bacterium]
MRYRLIDEALTKKNNPYPSLSTILDYVNEHLSGLFDDVAVSKRTIQKDIHDMRLSESLGFFAPIEYHLANKGYYYDDDDFSINRLPLKNEEKQVIELVANMLSRYENIPIFSNFKHITQKIFDALNVHSGIENDELLPESIQFDTYHESKGNEWLAQISEGIRKYRKVNIAYQPFGDSKQYKRTIHPYILKEFKGRWYLIGLSESSNEMRTYALDRITKIEVLDENFPLDENFNRKKYFEHSFGIYNLNYGEPLKVLLEFNLGQGYYILSRPIHSTQKLVSQSSSSIVVSLKLYVSEDFIMELLSFGDKVRVLEPQSLVNEIQARILKAAQLYS